MLSFLQAKGSYFVTFLVAFLLLATFAVVPTSAQEEMDDIYYGEEAMEEWERAIQELEEAMQEWGDDEIFLETFDEDDEGYYWTTGYDTGSDDAIFGLAALGIFAGIWLIMMLPLYIYFALTLMTVANKLGVKNAWFAWIPILNIILMFQCAGLTPWLFLLMFVPLVNIIVLVYAYMKIAERRGFESWLGILMIVPIANLIIPGYLAWAEPPKKAQ